MQVEKSSCNGKYESYLFHLYDNLMVFATFTLHLSESCEVCISDAS